MITKYKDNKSYYQIYFISDSIFFLFRMNLNKTFIWWNGINSLS